MSLWKWEEGKRQRQRRETRDTHRQTERHVVELANRIFLCSGDVLAANDDITRVLDQYNAMLSSQNRGAGAAAGATSYVHRVKNYLSFADLCSSLLLNLAVLAPAMWRCLIWTFLRRPHLQQPRLTPLVWFCRGWRAFDKRLTRPRLPSLSFERHGRCGAGSSSGSTTGGCSTGQRS